MRSTIKYFIQHPTMANLGVIILLGVGLLQLVNTQKTSFPKQKVRYIDIVLPFPGASPSEVEEGISVKVEDNLEGIDGIDRVVSSSEQNKAVIEVELKEYANADTYLKFYQISMTKSFFARIVYSEKFIFLKKNQFVVISITSNMNSI